METNIDMMKAREEADKAKIDMMKAREEADKAKIDMMKSLGTDIIIGITLVSICLI